MIKALFLVAAAATLTPVFSAGGALLLGMGFSLLFSNPFQTETKRMTAPLLQLSVVGLGAGMNLGVVGRAGLQGFAYTLVGIALTGAVGLALGRLVKTKANISLLITVGTA